MTYTIPNGFNIFDVVINTVGDLNSIYALIQANGIVSIESAPVGLIVNYTPPLVTPPAVISPSFAPPPTTASISTIAGQSIYDLTLQTYGDLNLTYKLIQDNKFSGVTTYPTVGNFFIFNPTMIKDAIFAAYLSKNGIIITTAGNAGNIQSGGLLTDSNIQIQTDSGINIIVD